MRTLPRYLPQTTSSAFSTRCVEVAVSLINVVFDRSQSGRGHYIVGMATQKRVPKDVREQKRVNVEDHIDPFAGGCRSRFPPVAALC